MPEITPESKPRVYLASQFPPAVLARIAERYTILPNATAADDLAYAAEGCDYLFVTPTSEVSRAVFATLAGTLKAVATLSVGFNHIDLDAAREHNVAVFNSPGVLTDATADLAMLLVLNAARRAYEGDTLVRSGKWEGWTPTQLLGLGLTGRRLGILGMGRIGQAIARRAKAFGMEIHYNNRSRLAADLEQGATYHATADDLLKVSDVFLLSAPASPELSGFLNTARIALLPPDAIVVNIARGEMVDDDALIEALATHRLFAAGLDVYHREPYADPRYARLPNVFLMPHLGSATEDTRNAMGFILLDGLEAVERGESASNRLC